MFDHPTPGEPTSTTAPVREEPEAPQLCAGFTEKGAPCRRHPAEGSDFCYRHDPQRVAARQDQLQPLFAGPVTLETAEEIRATLAEVANGVATRPNPPLARAYTLTTVLGVMLRSVRIRDLQIENARLRQEVAELTRTRAESERQLTYARRDAEMFRQTVTDLREQLRTSAR